MSEQKLRIGITGIGWYPATMLMPTIQATGRAEIVAIARRRSDRLALALSHCQCKRSA
jgi:predicted dehydrogenase